MEKLKFMTSNEVTEKIEKGERDFSNIKVFRLELIDKKLDGISFKNSELEGCRLRGSSLVGADFSGTKMNICDFVRADLTKASFKFSKLDWVAFPESILNGTDFTKSFLMNVLFVDANTAVANFSDAAMVNVIRTRPELTKDIFDRWASVYTGYNWQSQSKVFWNSLISGMKKTYFSNIGRSYIEGKRFSTTSRYKPQFKSESGETYFPLVSVYDQKSSRYANKGKYAKKK